MAPREPPKTAMRISVFSRMRQRLFAARFLSERISRKSAALTTNRYTSNIFIMTFIKEDEYEKMDCWCDVVA